MLTSQTYNNLILILNTNNLEKIDFGIIREGRLNNLIFFGYLRYGEH